MSCAVVVSGVVMRWIMYESKVQTVAIDEVVAKWRFRHGACPFVLVVDDDEVAAETVATALREIGYAVVIAYDGESALQLASLAPPDLMITDISMPGMDGLELSIRMHESFPSCRILLFSGLSDDCELLVENRERGFNFPLLTKPAPMAALLQLACQQLLSPTTQQKTAKA
ncbi:MAG TPA: response regulator [Terriglobales bacterium]|nr:response regulator [Terriglobales bacterium]